MIAMENKQYDYKGSLMEAQVAEASFKQELSKLSKNNKVEIYNLSMYHSLNDKNIQKIAQGDLQRKTNTISSLKEKLESMKKEFDEKIKNETFKVIIFIFI